MKELSDRYEVFLKVCETGSFSKAAEALNYTQSGISQIMAGLEDELGEPATAVITGGFAPLIAPYCRRQVVVDENLLLNGLYIIYKKNIPRR